MIIWLIVPNRDALEWSRKSQRQKLVSKKLLTGKAKTSWKRKINKPERNELNHIQIRAFWTVMVGPSAIIPILNIVKELMKTNMNTACTKTKKVAHNNVHFYLEILQFLNILKNLILKSNFTTFLIFWKFPLQEMLHGKYSKKRFENWACYTSAFNQRWNICSIIYIIVRNNQTFEWLWK